MLCRLEPDFPRSTRPHPYPPSLKIGCNLSAPSLSLRQLSLLAKQRRIAYAVHIDTVSTTHTMSPDKDLYQVLGLQPKASPAQIKKAWQDGSRMHHPDRNPHPDSTKRMQEINHAYDILSDPERRRQYDRTRQNSESNQGNSVSGSKKTSGNGAHEFGSKPAHPKPDRPICYWCNSDLIFQTRLCPQHVWCSSCFTLRYTRAAKDARCCERMVTHEEVVRRLPAAVAALYETKRACNFEHRIPPKLWSDLLRAVREWQEQNPIVAYGQAASRVLNEKIGIIDDLQEQLAEYRDGNKTFEANPFKVQADLNHQKSTIERLEKELKAAKAAPAQSENKLKDDIVRKDMRIRELERSNKLSKDANSKNIQMFSEAQKARNAAVASEAAMRKERDELSTELATTQSKLEKLQQASAGTDSRARAELDTALHARDAATAREAATAKRNKELEAELVKLQQDLETQRQAHSDEVAKVQAELSAAQSTQNNSTQNYLTTQNRCEDLEAQLAKAQLDLQAQQQALADKDSRHQFELSSAQRSSEAAIANAVNAEEELKGIKTQLANVQEEKTAAHVSPSSVPARTDLLGRQAGNDGTGEQSETGDATTHEVKSPCVVAATQNSLLSSRTLFEKRKAAKGKASEEAGLERLNTSRRASGVQSAAQATPNSASPRAPIPPRIASQQTARPVTVPLSKTAVASSASVSVPVAPSRSLHVPGDAQVNVPAPDTAKATLQGATTTRDQVSQDKATEIKAKAFDLAAFQKATAASTPSFTFSKLDETNVVGEPRPDHKIDLVTSTNATKDKTPVPPVGQTEHPESTNSQADDESITSMGLLRGQLHYAKATQKGAQEEARRATEEISRLRAELDQYRKFESGVKQEFVRANVEYASIQRKLEKTMKQLLQYKGGAGGAFRISANQFAIPVDNKAKNIGEHLIILEGTFEPIMADIKKPRAAPKVKKQRESPLERSARKNKELRDIIRQQERDIEDIRISFGNRWSGLLENVCAKESEIRRLKKRLQIP